MTCGSTQSPHHIFVPSLTALGIPSPFAGWDRIASRLLRLYERQQQRRHLRELDDRMLTDIGITRAQAEQESRKPFWR